MKPWKLITRLFNRNTGRNTVSVNVDGVTHNVEFVDAGDWQQGGTTVELVAERDGGWAPQPAPWLMENHAPLGDDGAGSAHGREPVEFGGGIYIEKYEHPTLLGRQGE